MKELIILITSAVLFGAIGASAIIKFTDKPVMCPQESVKLYNYRRA